MPPRIGKTTSTRAEVRLEACIIVIEQGPLRRSALADCTEAMARLEDARVAWHRFEREDKPAFLRWRAREFGALLSKARDVETQIGDCQALVHEVEMEMRRCFQDPYTAYERVMFRRKNPGAPEEPRAQPREAGVGRKLSEFEQEALFQDWVKHSLGTNPDKMDDEAYTKSFETFKTHMFQPPAAEQARNTTRATGRERTSTIEDEPEIDEAKNENSEADARVRELYRSLVRRLHPDLRADGNAAVSGLWHEVQEAYAAGDVARMELLLALSDLESSRLGEQTSLYQMRAVLAELERAIWALEKSVQEAEGEDAWNFARRGPDAELQARVGRQLRSDLAARSLRLDILKRALADWARGPKANRHVRVPQGAGMRS